MVISCNQTTSYAKAVAPTLRLQVIVDSIRRTTECLSGLENLLGLSPEEAAQAKDKFIQEAALFILLTKRVLDAPHLKDVLLDLVGQFDTGKFVEVVQAFPQAALAFGPLAVALDRFGETNHLIPRMVRRATASPHYLAADRVHFRQMEALWLREALSNDEQQWEDWLRFSILAKRTHPCFQRVSDAYAKTHCAMYVTDFGARCDLSAIDRATLRGDLDHHFAWTFACGDWDLLGEFLVIARYCLPTLSNWHGACEAALDAVFDKFGFVPPRNFSFERLHALPAARREGYQLLHAYHTNVVYGLDLLSRLALPRNHDSNRAAQAFDVNPFAALQQVGMQFDLTGTGFDLNWYCGSFDCEVDMDFVCDGLLIRAFREHGSGATRALLQALPGMPEGSRTAETRQELLDHALSWEECIAAN